MSESKQTGFHVGESCAFADGPAVLPISRGQRLRAEELGWRFTTLDAALSPQRQVQHLHQLIDLGVNAITSFTLDPTLTEPAYARAVAAGINVVTFGSVSPSAIAVIRQRVDDQACAHDAAAYIAARIPAARVLVIGGPPVPALAARTECFIRAAAQAGLRMVDREDNFGDIEDTARPIVTRLLDRHPETDAVWCFNDYTALAAARELQRRGRLIATAHSDGIIVSGISGFPMMIDAIRKGWATFTYDSNPVETGRAAIDLLHSVLVRGERQPGEVWIDFARYDLSNVNDFVPWIAR